MADRTDSFNRTAIGPLWTTITFTGFNHAMQIVSGIYATGTYAGGDNAAYWNEDVNWFDGSSDANIYVDITTYKPASAIADIESIIWKSTGAYLFGTYSNGVHLNKVTSGGSWTELDSAGDSDTPSTGDVYTLYIIAGTVYGRKNGGSALKTASDTTYRDSLKPGIYSYNNSTANLCIDKFEATGIEISDNGFVQYGYYPTLRYGDALNTGSESEFNAQKFQCPGTGTVEVNEIGVYVAAESGYTASFRLAIYTDDDPNGCPEAMVAGSETTELSHNTTTVTKKSYTYTGDKPRLTGGTYYWLCIFRATQYCQFDNFTTGGTTIYRNADSYPTWPTGATNHTHNDDTADYSLYAVITNTRYPYESLGVTDAISRIVPVTRAIQESLGITDSTYPVNIQSTIQFCSPSYEIYRYGADKYNTGSQAFDIPSDCTFLVVFVSAYHNDTNYLSNETGAMKCNGVNMNKGYITDGSTAAWMGQLFYLANPTTGTDVTIAWDFKTADDPMNYNVHLGAFYLKGVDTTSPIRGSGGENVAGATYNTNGNVTAQSGDLSIIAAWTYNTELVTYTWSPSVTVLTVAHDSNYIQSALAHHFPATNTTYQADTSGEANPGDDGGISVLVLKPAEGTTYNRYPYESLGLSDYTYQLRMYGRGIAENVGVSDARSMIRSYIRSVVETAGISDNVYRVESIVRGIADIFGITDYLFTQNILSRVNAESIGITDALFIDLILSTLKGVGISDAIVVQKILQRIISDSVGISDYQNIIKNINRYLSESIGVSDSIFRIATILKSISESVGLTDAQVRSLNVIRIAYESLGITDAEFFDHVVGGTTLERTISDTVGLTDAVYKLIFKAVFLSETVGVVGSRTENLLQYSNDFNQETNGWTRSNILSITTGETDPYGTSNASKMTEGAEEVPHMIYRTSGYDYTAGTYTLSVYAKEGTRSWIYLSLDNAETASAFFNLNNGSTGTVGLCTAAITSIGSGWYRCSITANITTKTDYPEVGIADADNHFSHDGDGTSYVYIYGAQLERYGLGPYINTTTSAITIDPLYKLMSIARAINDALQVWNTRGSNLQTYSEQQPYHDVMWEHIPYVPAPDGSNNAARFVSTPGTSNAFYPIPVVTGEAGKTYRASVYMKGENGKHIKVYFDTAGRTNYIDHYFSGEWERVSPPALVDPGAYALYFYVDNVVGESHTIDVWGYQIEEGTEVGPYVRTEGSAVTLEPIRRTMSYNRYQYENIILLDTGENLIPYSEQFDQWLTSGISSIDDDATTDPIGGNTADKIIESDTGPGQHVPFQNISGLDDNTVYTFSVYAKAGTRSHILMLMYGKDSAYYGSYFDIGNGTIDTTGSFPSLGKGIIDCGNGWYRCYITLNIGSGVGGPHCGVWIATDTPDYWYTGDGSSYIYLWGGQLEKRQYVGNYVKTTTTPEKASNPFTSHMIVMGIIESLGVTDYQNIYKILNEYFINIPETVGVTDYVVALRLLIRGLAESVGITDARTIQKAFIRAISEWLDVGDAQGRIATYKRFVGETEGISDYIARSLSYIRRPADSVGITDAVASFTTVVVFRYIADSLGLSDGRAQFTGKGRYVSDNVGITDARKQLLFAVRSLAENIGIVDYESYLKTMLRTIPEDIGVFEDNERFISYIRRISDTYGISDAAIGGLKKFRTVFEAIGVTDAEIHQILTALYLSIVIAIADQFIELSAKSKRISLDSMESRIILEVE